VTVNVDKTFLLQIIVDFGVKILAIIIHYHYYTVRSSYWILHLLKNDPNSKVLIESVQIMIDRKKELHYRVVYNSIV